MITVLTMLSVEVGDADTNKSLTLKEAKASPYWPDFQKAMRKELKLYIENNT